MKTKRIPTQNELRAFVKENDLNMFETFNAQRDDIEQTYLDVDTYIEDNREDLVEQWQRETPATLQERYDRAVSLYNENEIQWRKAMDESNWPLIFSTKMRTLNLVGYQIKLSQLLFNV